MKTPRAIEDLKAQWLEDGTWDIENTEGFEEHYDELLAYRRQVELERLQKAEQEVQDKAAFLGCPDNLQIARYVISLEQELSNIRSRLKELEKRIP